jgi:hypothetical protein
MTDIAELGIKAKSDGVSQAATDLDKLQKSSDNAEKSTEKLGKTSDAIQGSMRRLAVVAGAVGGALMAAFSARSVIDEAQKFETATLRMEAIIRATGGVAGRSADQLREQARSIAWSTLESTEGIMKAQQTLLTFRNVQGDVFDRTIKAAADMSAALGGDLNSATMQLAKALENPTEGLSALSRSGTVFTAAQKEMVKGMVEAGKMAEAQAFILSELEAQYGGTAEAAAGGLAGAQDTLAQAFQEAKLAIAEKTGALDLAASAYNTLAGVIIAFTNNIGAIAAAVESFGVIVVALAATQLPALIGATYAWVTAATAGATVTGVLTAAMVALRTAVAFLGGPVGVAIGLLTAVGGALFLAGNRANEARDKTDKLNDVYSRVPGLADKVSVSVRGTGAAAEDGAAGFIAHAKAVDQSFNAMADWLALAQQMPGGLVSPGGITIGGAGSGAGPIEDFLGISGGTSSAPTSSIRPNRAPALVDELGTAGGGRGGGGGGGGAGGAVADAFAERLEALTQGLQTERETIDLWYEESMAIINDRRALELLGEEDHAKAKLRIEELYQEQLRELGSARIGIAKHIFSELASLADSGSKRLAAIGKAANIAQAISDGYGAAVAAWKKGMQAGGPGLAAAYAGLSVLKTGAIISKMGGGGGSGGAGGGASAGIPAQSAPAPQRDVRVTVVGDGMFPDYLRQYGQELFETVMNEGGNRGTRVVMG